MELECGDAELNLVEELQPYRCRIDKADCRTNADDVGSILVPSVIPSQVDGIQLVASRSRGTNYPILEPKSRVLDSSV